MQQSGEVMPFCVEICAGCESITSDLTPSQVHVFYEGLGSMINAQTNKVAQEKLIADAMRLPNQAVLFK